MAKRILVTGGAGFLGSHLCDRLIERGDEVICLDNYFTGQKKNIAHLTEHPRFELVRHDIVNPYFAEVDQIYNLACPASPVHYQYNAIKTLKTSFIGAMNMLGLAKRTKARILQASTSEIYGDPLIHPQSESYWGNVNTLGPRACYDEGKRVAESLFINYKDQHEVDIRMVRIFNTYGPRMHPEDGRVVSNFITQALLGKDLTIYGKGNQTRSFCFYSDLIEGLILTMESANYIGPINLGNPREFTIKELSQLIRDILGGHLKVIEKDLPKDDPTQRKPDISLAKSKLGWEPQVNLEEGLLQTIEYFKKELNIDE